MPDDSDLPELSPRVPPGLYRHYRGGLYRVIDTVRHSETLAPLTLYQALYGQQGLWVRPAAMFQEMIEVGGRQVQRFTPVDEAGLPEA